MAALSRRALFGLLRPRTTTSSSSRRRLVPFVRPPGALEEAQFLEACTRCTDCREACPHDAIVPVSNRFADAAGTPAIDAVQAPCRECPDTPCIAACETGALAGARRPIALVSITEWACLAHQGSFCSVCSEQCPVPGAIRTDAGRPTIESEACTGCGVCLHVCPAPQKAILYRPRPSAVSP